mmetsp:Transcript_13470/g.17444  ORF Transcript_13470/g.17444 Transcript_13470/m.17444 type:complete len:261 (+) Transcript_13470:26-808(+)
MANPVAEDLSNGLSLYVSHANETRYHVMGSEMQIVNVELTPGASMEVAPGAMMHHGPNIYAQPHCSCSCGRYCTGESNIYMTFENKGKDAETIGLTPVFPAKVIPVHLTETGTIIVRKTSFMCGIGDVKIGVSFDCCNTTSCLGGLGAIRQKVSGDGICFLQAGGTVLEKTLEAGESLVVDQESIVGWQQTVKLGTKMFGGCCGCCSNICGGEGCFMATLAGPGKIWITSMSFSKWYRTLQPTISEVGVGGQDVATGETE